MARNCDDCSATADCHPPDWPKDGKAFERDKMTGTLRVNRRLHQARLKLSTSSFRFFIFPLFVSIPAFFITLFGISGTSVGSLNFLADGNLSRAGVLAGSPKPIRSDEWNVATPLLVHQAHSGFAQNAVTGLGVHNLSIIYDIPTWGWPTFFRPWDVPPLFLGLTQGFAARWWLMLLIAILGVYCLLLELTKRIDIAALFSLGLCLSPFFMWWYEGSTFGPIGMGSLAAFFFLRLLRSRRQLSKIVLVAATAWASVGFVLVLYPPFQVPVGLAIVCIAVAEIFARWKFKNLTLRTLLTSTLWVAVPTGLLLLIFLVQYKTAIHAISSTIYPGNRRLLGGRTSIEQLASAPFGLVFSRHGFTELTGTNQSEISSFLLLGPFALLQLFRTGLRRWDDRTRYLLVGASVATVLLGAWYFVGLPSPLAKLLLLDRVPPERGLIGVGLAGFLLMALFCSGRLQPDASVQASAQLDKRRSLELSRQIAWGAFACAVLAFGFYVWGGEQIQLSQVALGLGSGKVVLYSLFAAIVIGLLSARRVVSGGILLVIFGLVVSGTVNPLYRGLGVLESSPLLTEIHSLSAQGPSGRNDVWVNFGGPDLNAPLVSAGVPTLNGSQLYPDRSFWSQFPNSKDYEIAWNRYANTYFAVGEPGSAASVKLLQQDLIMVTLDVCSPEASRLKLGYFISPQPLVRSCLIAQKTVKYQGHNVYFYSRVEK